MHTYIRRHKHRMHRNKTALGEKTWVLNKNKLLPEPQYSAGRIRMQVRPEGGEGGEGKSSLGYKSSVSNAIAR